MDWKICAADDLRRYRLMKIGILNSRDKLRAIEHKKTGTRTRLTQRTTRSDPQVLDAIVEAERIKTNIAAAERITKLIERGLESLNDEERKILELLYLNDEPNMRKLRDELGYAPRSLYRLRDRALKNFTLAMYGVENL